jgi:hypothetical protein
MIRLNTVRVVSWEFVGQGVEVEFPNFSGAIPTNHFHHIIATVYFEYSTAQEGDDAQRFIVVVPLYKGEFRDPTFQRIEVHQIGDDSYLIPYVQEEY